MKTKVNFRKPLNFFFKVMVFLSVFSTLLSCNSDGIEVEVKQMNSEKNKSLIEYIAETNNEGIPFPQGSKVYKLRNGNFKIELPENQKFIAQGTGVTSKVIDELADAEVSCSCSDGRGCSPLLNNGKYYCVMESSCKTCDMRVANYGFKGGVVIRDVINYNEDISIITKGNKRNYKSIKSYVLRLPKVQKGIHDFYRTIFKDEDSDLIYKNKVNDKDYLFAKVNIYGFEMMLPVLKKNQKKMDVEFLRDLPMDELQDVGGIKCSCETYELGCVKTKGFGGYYCSAGQCAYCRLID